MDCIAEISRDSGFHRLQAFMQAHPAWPALDWLKKRSEEALFGDRKSAPQELVMSGAGHGGPNSAHSARFCDRREGFLAALFSQSSAGHAGCACMKACSRWKPESRKAPHAIHSNAVFDDSVLCCRRRGVPCASSPDL